MNYNYFKRDKLKMWEIKLKWIDCPYLKKYPNIPHIACNPKLDCLHIKSKTHSCTRKNCPLKLMDGYVIVGINPDNQPTISEIYLNKEDAEKQLTWYSKFKNNCNRFIYTRVVNTGN